ncbi:hypothetical protein KIPB_002361 [Kipferlia bialata]|uniref:Transmembrane protein n=1 Tax=Kipferlia bialata TaxID=797122 RepID=A0A9K3CQA7_9EUKA|nr:hypothetical protein KIPB_002361 [Kipferlia bialata]|eukprot:g2361.t1
MDASSQYELTQELDTPAKRVLVAIFTPTVLFAGWRGGFVLVSGCVYGFNHVYRALALLNNEGFRQYLAYMRRLLLRYLLCFPVFVGLICFQQYLKGIWYQCIPSDQTFWRYRWFQMGEIESNPLTFFGCAMVLITLVSLVIIPITAAIVRCLEKHDVAVGGKMVEGGVDQRSVALVPLCVVYYALALVVPLLTEPVRDRVMEYKSWTRMDYATMRQPSGMGTLLDFWGLWWPQVLAGWFQGILPFFGSMLQVLTQYLLSPTGCYSYDSSSQIVSDTKGVSMGLLLRWAYESKTASLSRVTETQEVVYICEDPPEETACALVQETHAYTSTSGVSYRQDTLSDVDRSPAEVKYDGVTSSNARRLRVLRILYLSSLPLVLMALGSTVYYGLDYLLTSPDGKIDPACQFMSVSQHYAFSAVQTCALAYFVQRRFSTMSLTVFGLEFLVEGPVTYMLRWIDPNIIGWMNSRDPLGIILRWICTMVAWVGDGVSLRTKLEPLSNRHLRCGLVLALEDTTTQG